MTSKITFKPQQSDQPVRNQITLLGSGFETEDLLASIVAEGGHPSVVAQPQWQARGSKTSTLHAE